MTKRYHISFQLPNSLSSLLKIYQWKYNKGRGCLFIISYQSLIHQWIEWIAECSSRGLKMVRGSNWAQKIWLFQLIYEDAYHNLFGAWNDKKRGFYSIFVVSSEKFWILKFVFLACFESKMTKTDILNLKLIVSDDYQQFCAHFEWFLSLFHISNVKHKCLLVKQKVCKNSISWAKNLF